MSRTGEVKPKLVVVALACWSPERGRGYGKISGVWRRRAARGGVWRLVRLQSKRDAESVVCVGADSRCDGLVCTCKDGSVPRKVVERGW